MSTKLQKQKKRSTKQVRLGSEWHIKVKIRAAEEEKTIAQLLDEICETFFSKPKI
jgi:hypothetical protein